MKIQLEENDFERESNKVIQAFNDLLAALDHFSEATGHEMVAAMATNHATFSATVFSGILASAGALHTEKLGEARAVINAMLARTSDMKAEVDRFAQFLVGELNHLADEQVRKQR